MSMCLHYVEDINRKCVSLPLSSNTAKVVANVFNFDFADFRLALPFMYCMAGYKP
jgi:hypothetical protein